MIEQKLLKAEVRNFKGVSYIELTLQDFTVISGQNRQGKTSFLDAIQSAIGGPKALKSTNTTIPIKIGEIQAEVILEFTDFVLTRSWEGDKNKLNIIPKKGTEYIPPKNQTMLDEYFGQFIDPSQIYKMDNEKLSDMVAEMLGIKGDLINLKARKELVYNQRRDVNRDAKELEAKLSRVPKPKDNLPAKEISIQDLSAKLEKAKEEENQLNLKKEKLNNLIEKKNSKKMSIINLEENIKKLQAELENSKKEYDKIIVDGKALEKEINETYLLDTTEIRIKLDEAEELNKQIRHAINYSQIQNDRDDKYAEANDLTGEIEQWDNRIKELLNKTEFPVKELSFGENSLIYNNVPIDQCSSEERLTICSALAMSKDTPIKLLLIRDGAAYDDNHLKLLADMAKEKNYIVLIEKPGEIKEMIVIENGGVKNGK